MNDEAVQIDDEPADAPVEAQEQPQEAPQEAPQEQPEGEKSEKVEFSEAQQAVFDREIARKVAAQREAERKAEEAQRAAEEATKRLEEAQKTDRPQVPQMPDPYDDDYEAKVKARDDALLEAARWDNQQVLLQQQEQARQQQAVYEEQQRISKTAEAYREQAVKLGVDGDRLRNAGQVVANFGIDEGLVRHILSDERGPEITCYLAEHLTELEQINAMEPMRAAAYIESTIKGKARPARAEPSPPETQTEAGASFKPEEGLPGVTYE